MKADLTDLYHTLVRIEGLLVAIVARLDEDEQLAEQTEALNQEAAELTDAVQSHPLPEKKP